MTAASARAGRTDAGSAQTTLLLAVAALLLLPVLFGAVLLGRHDGAQAACGQQAIPQPGIAHAADGIPGAARFLLAHGAPGNLTRAVFAYNPDPGYVRRVMAQAARYATATAPPPPAPAPTRGRAQGTSTRSPPRPAGWPGSSSPTPAPRSASPTSMAAPARTASTAPD